MGAPPTYLKRQRGTVRIVYRRLPAINRLDPCQKNLARGEQARTAVSAFDVGQQPSSCRGGGACTKSAAIAKPTEKVPNAGIHTWFRSDCSTAAVTSHPAILELLLESEK